MRRIVDRAAERAARRPAAAPRTDTKRDPIREETQEVQRAQRGRSDDLGEEIELDLLRLGRDDGVPQFDEILLLQMEQRILAPVRPPGSD